jgi:hypothetical protein
MEWSWAEVVAQVAEHLPNKHKKTLNSNPTTVKKKNGVVLVMVEMWKGMKQGISDCRRRSIKTEPHF